MKNETVSYEEVDKWARRVYAWMTHQALDAWDVAPTQTKKDLRDHLTPLVAEFHGVNLQSEGT